MGEYNLIPDSSAGPFPELRAFLGSLLHHVMGLISLAGWEGREASAHYLRLIITLIGTLFFLLLGYLFLLSFFVLLLWRWLKIDSMWIALVLAAVHGIIGLLGIWMFNRNVGKSLFASTFSEIKRDIENLRSPPETLRPPL